MTFEIDFPLPLKQLTNRLADFCVFSSKLSQLRNLSAVPYPQRQVSFSKDGSLDAVLWHCKNGQRTPESVADP